MLSLSYTNSLPKIQTLAKLTRLRWSRAKHHTRRNIRRWLMVIKGWTACPIDTHTRRCFRLWPRAFRVVALLRATFCLPVRDNAGIRVFFVRFVHTACVCVRCSELVRILRDVRWWDDNVFRESARTLQTQWRHENAQRCFFLLRVGMQLSQDIKLQKVSHMVLK